MAETCADLLGELVTAHRILVKEGVLDGFGHVSVRNPERTDRFWLASALPASRIRAADMIAFGLDGSPVEPTEAPVFAERFIHAEIYRARPDVGAVCHHHAPSIMPFCLGGTRLLPVSQTGAFMGGSVPLWDSAKEFGDTGMLVDGAGQAASLARALGQGPLVLMRGHGATVVGRSLREVVFRSIYSCLDADHQRRAAALGTLTPLSPGETGKAGRVSAAAIDRCWSHWTVSLPAGPDPGSKGPAL